MKYYQALIFVFASLCYYTADATVKDVLLSKAIQKKFVQIEAISLGGYRGECLDLKVKNNTSAPLNVYVDPALIFQPSDTSYQDLVAVGGFYLAILPQKDTCAILQTFCGKSYASSPRRNINYKLLRQGDDVMVSVADFIREHKLYNGMGQSAIWSLTNNHSLSTIYSRQDTGLSKELIKMIAKKTGREIPQFYTIHKVNYDAGSDNSRNSNFTCAPVFNPEVEKYVVVVEWQNSTSNRNLHVFVLKEDGEVFYEHNDETITSRGHKATVEFDPKKVPKGKYTVILRDDDNVIYQQNEVLVM